MTTTPPTTHASGLPRDAVDARIAMLRAEMEVAADRAHKAALQYELGHVTETELAQEAQAVREYLGAYNLDPSFQPPLAALVRIFERRRSFKNLARLYEAETKSAATPEERASSLVDRGALLEDQLGQPDLAPALYEQAIADDPEGAALPALFLERLLLARGERDAAIDVIAKRAEVVQDPTLKGMLWIEVARGREERGDVDGALDAARQAATLPAARYRFLEQLERIARRHSRVPEIVAALEGRAAVVSRIARGEDAVQGSGAFSTKRFPEASRAAGEAAALYREAARIRMLHLRPEEGGDAQGALSALGKAIQLRPDDLALHRDRMLAAELAGDLGIAAEEARRLLAAGVEGRHAAPLYFRVAEDAQSRGATDEARAALIAALEADPGSAVVAAMLEDLSLAGAVPGDGRIEDWTLRLAARAEASEGDTRARIAWQAAHLAAARLRDVERAQPLYELAHGATSGEAEAPLRAEIAREWLGASLRLGHAVSAREAARALLSPDLEAHVDAEERSAVLRDLLELERVVFEDGDAAAAVLERALGTEASAGWAPDVARLHAASTGDVALLARSHRMLAQRATEPDAQAAHLCAAARALVRSGDLDAARIVLVDALQRVPGHRYAVALLEEVYRSRGDADAVVRLLRDTAEADRAGRAAETSLLLAGAAAEAAGDTALAASTYEEAIEHDPSAIGPLFALRRLAEAKGDEALMVRVLERLSEIEVSAGAPGRATLELGEQYQIVDGKPGPAEAPLRLALGVADLAAPAALDLALLGASMPAALLDGTRELAARAEGDARVWLLRELGGAQLDTLGELADADATADEILALASDDPWALLAKLRATFAGSSAREGARAEAMLALADGTSDAQASAELVVHALRASALAGAANDEAVLRAAELDASLPGSFAAAIAGLEALSEADDPSERADAIGRWVEHASTESAAALRAAQGRALAAAGRGDEACELLRAVLAASPDDLASWDALRVAARDAERWTDLVEACDRLASAVSGELRATLLEEAAAVLMDQLEGDEEAERRLREALAIDGARAVAYGRVHDLLAERGDERGLLELVQGRADRTDDADLLEPLFYEIARLHRSLGQRDEALVALDNLLMLEPEHVGGLALFVELQVQREAWPEAVEALRTLAAAGDVPASQRRIARLGAADFLDKKLQDPAGALQELAEIDALGLGDRGLFERMADLAERAGRIDAAIAALAKAADATRDPGRPDPVRCAAIERRAGQLWDERLGDEAQAIAAYRRALESVPTDVAAGAALSALLDAPKRTELSRDFEASVRRALAEDPTEPELLRALATAAGWRGDKPLETAVLGALVALDLASDDERERLGEETEVLRRLAPGTLRLSDQRLAEMFAPGFDGPVLELAQLATETLIEMDRLEPSAWGFGRTDLTNAKAPPPVAVELAGIASLFGAPAGDVWIGGTDPQLLSVIPSYKGKPAWLAGTAIIAPLGTTRRFEAGRRAMALRLGIGPLVARGADGAATALFAVAAGAGSVLPIGEGRAGMAEATRAATKAVSRRVRKAIPDVVARIGDGGRPVTTFASAAQQTFARGGLLISGDLPSVLERVLGERPDRERVRASDSALDLLRFWISPSALAARRELGLAS